MNINVQYNGTTAIVSPKGFVDEHTAPIFKGKLDDLISHRVKTVRLDMSGVDFMDSTGVGVLLSRYKTMRANGIDLTLSNCNGQVDKLFRLTGIYTIIKVR